MNRRQSVLNVQESVKLSKTLHRYLQYFGLHKNSKGFTEKDDSGKIRFGFVEQFGFLGFMGFLLNFSPPLTEKQ